MILTFLRDYVCFSLIWTNFGGNCQDFGYEGDEGPSHWHDKYANCAGKLQSPIDIETTKVIKKEFPPLIFNHFGERMDVVLFENNGHTVTMKIVGDLSPTLQGGPLKGMYKFSQLHFHWGPNNTIGSENQINHRSFPLELHLVMYNTMYDKYDDALNSPDGLTVLSFLFLVGSRDNEKFDSFIDGVRHVRTLLSNKTLYDFVSLDTLLAIDKRSYFTYDGSLTTPPCSELVTWIEFENTMHLAREQLDEFRSLSAKHGHLTHNYRPTQPINDRWIYYNAACPKSQGSMLYIAISLFIVAYCSSI